MSPATRRSRVLRHSRAIQGHCGFDPFLLLLHAHDLPLPETEFRFHPVRQFRFDYCWPHALLAIEREGGIWTGGRHTRGAGYLRDMEKYNLAQLEGWIVLRYTPQQLEAGAVLETIRQVLR